MHLLCIRSKEWTSLKMTDRHRTVLLLHNTASRYRVTSSLLEIFRSLLIIRCCFLLCCWDRKRTFLKHKRCFKSPLCYVVCTHFLTANNVWGTVTYESNFTFFRDPIKFQVNTILFSKSKKKAFMWHEGYWLRVNKCNDACFT